jgi:ParB/RepB/Spo0J family partition protein
LKTVLVEGSWFGEGGPVRRALSYDRLTNSSGGVPAVKTLAVDGALYTVTSLGALAADAWELAPRATYKAPRRHGGGYGGVVVTCRGVEYVMKCPVKLVAKVEGGAHAVMHAPSFKPIEREAAALQAALHGSEGAAARWEERRGRGLTDAELRAAIGEEFGMYRSQSSPDGHPGFAVKGLRRPRFWLGSEFPGDRIPDLQGRALVQAVRELMRIPKPCGRRLEAEDPPSRTWREGMPVEKQDLALVGEPLLIAPGRIAAHPDNPREAFEEEALQELAASIAEHGLIEPLVVMPAPDGAHGRWQLIAGERRLRAAVRAGLERVPCVIRYPKDAAEVVALMLAENLHREPLDPIAQARGFQRLAELGWAQKRIAASFEVSQPVVSNALRLLELPEDVQGMVTQGLLNGAQARALCRFKAFPAVASAIATLAVENGWSSKQLEADPLPGSAELERRGLVASLAYERFGVQDECDDCPFGARVTTGHESHGTWGWRCLKPEHAAELKAAWEANWEAEKSAAAVRLLEMQEAARSAARTVTAEAGAKGGAAPDLVLTTPETGAPGLDAPSPAPELPVLSPAQAERLKQSLPRLATMAWNAYEKLGKGRHVPAGCSEQCECRGLAIDHDGSVVPICAKPRRFALLNGRAERAERAEREARLQVRWDATAAVIGTTETGALHVLQPRPMAAIVSYLGSGLDDSAVAAALREIAAPGLSKDDFSRWKADKPETLDKLTALPVPRLLDLALRMIMAQARFRAVCYRETHAGMLDWLAGGTLEQAPLPPGVRKCRRCGLEGVADVAAEDGEADWARPDLCTECAGDLFAAGALDEEGNDLPCQPCRACGEPIGVERLACEGCGAFQGEEP